ncbi:MAG: hypothetical protein J6C25_05030 [Treponema sp.]|nr:hypothetical protein [Treponema sp.]
MKCCFGGFMKKFKKILFSLFLVCSITTILSCQKEPEIVYVPTPGTQTDGTGTQTDGTGTQTGNNDNKPNQSNPFIGNWGGSFSPMGYENISFSFLNDYEVKVWIKLSDGTDSSVTSLYTYSGKHAWIDTDTFDGCDFILSGSEINVYNGNELMFTLWKY